MKRLLTNTVGRRYTFSADTVRTMSFGANPKKAQGQPLMFIR